MDELRAKSIAADDAFRWLPGMRPLLLQPGHPSHLRPFPRADREYAARLDSGYPWWACVPDLDDAETVKALATLGFAP